MHVKFFFTCKWIQNIRKYNSKTFYVLECSTIIDLQNENIILTPKQFCKIFDVSNKKSLLQYYFIYLSKICWNTYSGHYFCIFWFTNKYFFFELEK